MRFHYVSGDRELFRITPPKTVDVPALATCGFKTAVRISDGKIVVIHRDKIVIEHEKPTTAENGS